MSRSFAANFIICPGFHSPQLTEDFITAMGWLEMSNLNYLVIPSTIPPYDCFAIYQWLSQQLDPKTSLCFLGFSAGVVGAMGSALTWQQNGGTVKALMAIDGWGVPLFGSVPIYRISHDRVTHYSSQLLGTGEQNFYCSPPVSHLYLWQCPDKVTGWWEIKLGCRERCSAAKMINRVLAELSTSSSSN